MAVSNMKLIRALVSQLRETQALACEVDAADVADEADDADAAAQNHNIPDISNFGDIIMCIYVKPL